MPNPNPAASPTPGAPIVGLNVKEQFYKGMSPDGRSRMFWDSHGTPLSESEFKKLNPDGYTEGVAANSHMEKDTGFAASPGAEHLVTDPLAGGPSNVHKSGDSVLAVLGKAAGAGASPTAPPPPPPTPMSATSQKVSDLSGGIGEGNPILDGIASALQYRKPYLG